jgi:pyruvate formate-lyase activating enzyme-like uncharacterized protein
MRISREEKDRHWEKNRAELGEAFGLLKFASEAEAREAGRLREELLAAAGDGIAFRRRGTKPVYRGMSPGCERCGSGSWSCLFINGKCNGRCFYCPTEQTRTGLPVTNTLSFPRVQDYADYVERFGFTGVSISGGEPLLTPDLTLKFIAAVRKRFGDRVYLWMYTNGTLATPDLLARLKDAGVNEIRFDIGAAGYSLDKAALAAGMFDHVTVEIPAVPEDYGLMTVKLREMADRGISFLNLHQLRLTPHNLPRLIDRGYTFLHGGHVTVLESELTALKLIRHAVEENISLPVNYCSFVYKDRFQKAAARRRCAETIRKGHEDVTGSGYIRSLQARGPAPVMAALADALGQGGAPSGQWLMPGENDRLLFAAALWDRIPLDDCSLSVAYSDSRLVPAISYANPFQEIRLNRKRSVFVERTRVSEEMAIPPDQVRAFGDLIRGESAAGEPEGAPGIPDRLLAYESIPRGLADYF